MLSLDLYLRLQQQAQYTATNNMCNTGMLCPEPTLSKAYMWSEVTKAAPCMYNVTNTSMQPSNSSKQLNTRLGSESRGDHSSCLLHALSIEAMLVHADVASRLWCYDVQPLIVLNPLGKITCASPYHTTA